MQQRKLTAFFAAAVALAPGAAAAHPGIAHVHDAVSGFLHPFGGIDHMLAMFAVGVFAAQIGGRARWLVPAAFVVTMAAAGALAVAGIPFPHVEFGIALSVAALGLAIALKINVPTLAAMAIAAVFAVFHGYAHGNEMPATLSGLAYGLGFVSATALLHALGVGCFMLLTALQDRFGDIAVRVMGGGVACVGAVLLLVP